LSFVINPRASGARRFPLYGMGLLKTAGNRRMIGTATVSARPTIARVCPGNFAPSHPTAAEPGRRPAEIGQDPEV